MGGEIAIDGEISMGVFVAGGHGEEDIPLELKI